MTFKKLALLGGHAARGIARLRQLTPARVDFLAMLLRGPLCQRDIAARLCVTESVVSRMVRVLMKRGLVVREIPEADKRYRVVSLTVFARGELAGFNGRERFLNDDGRHDLQAVGESLWRGDWEEPLDAMQLGALEVIDRHDFRATPAATEPPYAAIRRHLRYRFYDGAFPTESRHVEADWPWTIHDQPPPMHQGSTADPLSMRYAREWQPPVRSRAPE